MRDTRLSVVALVALSLAGATAARAQDIETRELPALGVQDRTLLAPLLARGLVVVAPRSAEDPAALCAVRIAVPAAEIAALLADPVGYPRFVGVLDSVRVTGRHDASLAFDWQWRNAVLEMHGTEQLDIVAPPVQRPDAGWRFAMRASSGDLGRGRILVRIVPDGPRAALLTVAVRLDVEQATYVARQLAGSGRTLNRISNIAIASLVALGVRRAVEHRARPRPASALAVADDAALTWDGPDPATFSPLLAANDLLLIELDDAGSLRRVTSIARAGARREAVIAALRDPSAFGDALLPGSRSTVEGRDHGATRFAWTVDIPFVGATAHMRLRDLAGADGVAIDGSTGAMHGGRWRIVQFPQGATDSIVVAAARFDVTDTVWLVRSFAGGSPDLALGLTAACELMVARAVRSGASSHGGA